MKCKFKNVECKFAGVMFTAGCKELGEPEGFHEHNICYNDEINRDPTKCVKKRKPRIYISGPISGHDMEERRKAFKEIQEHLEAQGYEAINPMENGLPDEADIHDHMRRDIELLMTCDYIYLLKRWTHSKGCMVELEVATSIGLPVMFEESPEITKFI